MGRTPVLPKNSRVLYSEDRLILVGSLRHFSSFLIIIFTIAISYLLFKGVGIWGINIPVAWGFAITNFVWWIGIGHAGTFISAVLLLLHQEWRTSINRFAESMTLFAVTCAGLHAATALGRPWFFYWIVPYPDTMDLWPQFRSPLVWDFFAVSTYLTVSLVFWYIGLIPDFASMRDEAQKIWQKKIYGIGVWLARMRSTLAALSICLSASCRFSDSLGCFCS